MNLSVHLKLPHCMNHLNHLTLMIHQNGRFVHIQSNLSVNSNIFKNSWKIKTLHMYAESVRFLTLLFKDRVMDEKHCFMTFHKNKSCKWKLPYQKLPSYFSKSTSSKCSKYFESTRRKGITNIFRKLLLVIVCIGCLTWKRF